MIEQNDKTTPTTEKTKKPRKARSPSKFVVQQQIEADTWKDMTTVTTKKKGVTWCIENGKAGDTYQIVLVHVRRTMSMKLFF